MKRNDYDKHCNEITIQNAMIYAYGTDGNIIKVKEIFNELIKILSFIVQLIPIKKISFYCIKLKRKYN